MIGAEGSCFPSAHRHVRTAPLIFPPPAQAAADSDFEIDLVSSGEEEEAGSKGKGKASKAPPKKKAKASPAQQQQAQEGQTPTKVGGRWSWCTDLPSPASWRRLAVFLDCECLRLTGMYTNTSAPRSATPACFIGLPAAIRFSLLPCPVPAQRGKSATPGGSKKKAKGATGPLAGLQGELAGNASPRAWPAFVEWLPRARSRLRRRADPAWRRPQAGLWRCCGALPP